MALRILVVEDDEPLLGFYREALGDLGHEVTIARNGAEGLARLRPEHGLIITDIGMPVMSGDEMVRELRQRAEHRSTPVLVLTARREPLEPLAADVATVIMRKPFPLERFLDHVEEAARAKR